MQLGSVGADVPWELPAAPGLLSLQLVHGRAASSALHSDSGRCAASCERCSAYVHSRSLTQSLFAALEFSFLAFLMTKVAFFLM